MTAILRELNVLSFVRRCRYATRRQRETANADYASVLRIVCTGDKGVVWVDR